MSPRLEAAGGSRPSRGRIRIGSGLTVPLALVLDAALGEPPHAVHPVVWIGTTISCLERFAPSGQSARLAYGAAMTAVVVGGAALMSAAVSRFAGRLPPPLGLLVDAWMLKTTIGVRSLMEAGHAVENSLAGCDLGSAREAARSLVSRDVRCLGPDLLASAAVESLAENTSDSIVAPLLYYAVGGLPAAFAYRAANTLDAMIGYHGEYEHLGKAAARMDDMLNLLPSRLTSALLLAAGAVGGGDVATGLAIARRDHGLTASPNAGWPMSAMAGLLGTRLEKPGQYSLGRDLPPPDPPAIDHAAELVKAGTILAVPVTLGVGWLVSRLMCPWRQTRGR